MALITTLHGSSFTVSHIRYGVIKRFWIHAMNSFAILHVCRCYVCQVKHSSITSYCRAIKCCYCLCSVLLSPLACGFFFLFFVVFFVRSPAISLGFTTSGWDFCVCDRFFHPAIKVVTFRLRGWCVLGVFLLPAFTRLGHERQDLWSPCDDTHVCTD